MRVRKNLAYLAVPAALILSAAVSQAGVPAPATAASAVSQARVTAPATAASAVSHAGVPGSATAAFAVSHAVAGAPDQPRAAAAPVLSMRAWGDNSAGELGNGSLAAATTPVPVGNLSGIGSVSSGGRHALARLANGAVMAWGDDTFGQLGNGTTSANNNAEVPVAVTGVSTAVAVAAGGEHSLALLANGTVLAWGDNRNGQLGDGTTTSRDVPVTVKGLTNVTAISAGDLFSVAVLADGRVMAWGHDNGGQLGNGDNTFTDQLVPVAVKGLTTVKTVSAGGMHVLALMRNGTAAAWGENSNGQLGSGSMTPGNSNVPVPVTGLTGVTALSAGSDHSMALLSSGAVQVWGDNGFNQLAQPNGFPGGISSSDVPIPVKGVGQASAVAAGGLSSMVLLTTGTVMAWGDGAFGQLGNGTTATRITPTAVKGLTGVTAISAGGPYATALTASPAAPPPSPTPSIWQVVPTPDPGGPALSNLSFNGVSAASPTSAWAVGTDQAASQAPLAEHWNGQAWTKVTVPVPAGTTQASFGGTIDLSPSNAWAVGSTGGAGGTGARTLIEHWNGTAWAIVPSPDPQTAPGASDSLTAIAGSGPNDLWAVGSFSDGAHFIALLFEHWNGAAWSFVPPPTEVGFQFATAVTAISATDAWAVGNTGGQATVSAHWNGTSWSEVPAPVLISKNSVNFLTGVGAAGAQDVWASGYEGNVNGNNFRQPYMLHWTGKSWKLVTLPNAGTEGSLLSATAVLSPSDVWSVGITNQSDGALLALTEHFNGTTWSISPSLDPGQLAGLPDSALSAVASPGHGVVWALGTQEIPGQCCLRTLALTTSRG